MNPRDQFTGVNAGYVYELYERYQRNPESVDESTRAMFAHWSPEIEGVPSAAIGAPGSTTPGDLTTAIAAFNLAESIRRFGHLAAQLDPLGVSEPVGDPSLVPESHGLTAETLARLPASVVSGTAAAGSASALE